jgi:FimV-like protein
MRFLTDPSHGFRTAVAATLCCALFSSVAPAAAVDRAGAQPPIAKAKAAAPAADAAIRAMVDAWGHAWSTQDVERYLAFYAPDFKPRDGRTRNAWEKLRRSRVTGPSSIEISISGIEIVPHDGARAAVTFRQRYRSDRIGDRVTKTLALVLDGDRWLIVAERVGSVATRTDAAPVPVSAPQGSPGIAAGLGTLRVLSTLGEPLRAEIEIISLRAGEQRLVRARAASAEALRQAGIETRLAPGDVKMEIQLRDGKPIVAVTTRDAVNEPILEMLVELAWASGRLQRKYAFLLDPPTIPVSPSTSRATIQPPAAVTAPPPPRAAPTRPAPAARPAAAVDEYRVLPGDTLGRIARTRRHAGATLEQMMIALYRANPGAFINADINALAVGRSLKIPDRDSATAVDPEQARQAMRALAAGSGRQRAAIAVAVPTVPGTGGADATAQPVPSPDQVELERIKASKASAAAAVGDDRISGERALAETRSRIGELEKIYADLQKSLVIKDQQRASLEKRAAEKRSAAARVPVAKAAAAPALPPSDAKPRPPTAPRPALTPPASEPSLVDEYLGDPLMRSGLGAVALLLVGYGVFAWRKKKRAALPQIGEAQPPATTYSAATTAAGQGVVDLRTQADAHPVDGREPQAEAPVVEFDIEPSSTGMDLSTQVDVTQTLHRRETTGQAPVAFELSATESGIFDIDLGEASAEPVTADGATAELDAHLSTIKLDLSDIESAATSATDGDAKFQEIVTKLDLAQAYKEIADPDSARELLNEVLVEGDTAQQERAREMLASLG